MRGKALLDALASQVIVGDGGIATELHQRGVEPHVSFDGLNLSRPELVAEIHRDYVAAGARLVETNTFGANRLRLEQYHLADKLTDINAAGVRLARAAAGGRAFVAGAIGPLPPLTLADDATERAADEMYDIFAEQIAVLAEAGADAIVLKTFSDIGQIQIALRAARTAADLPVIAQLTFRHRAGASGGVDVYPALQGLADAGADVVGTNCGRGAANVLHIIEEFGAQSHARLSAFPNAGFPTNVGGRIVYPASPEYMATIAERLVEAGANIVGGCCGTGPRELAAMVGRLEARRPARRLVRPVPRPAPPRPAEPGPRPPSFADRLRDAPTVVVELDPPCGFDYSRVIESCRMLRDRGTDAVVMGDSPLAAMRMSSIAMAALVQREVGVECIVGVSCRDRNLIALQGDLIGAWALGIRNVLAITGDPVCGEAECGARGVFDVNSIGCIRMIAGLNAGVGADGASVGGAASFGIGCGFNPNFRNLAFEVHKLRRKVDAGAHFIFTQIVFDAGRFAESVRLVREAGIDAPILPAVYPLLSRRNAEFIHNELPGARLPQAVLDRMAGADGASASREGAAIARELIEQTAPHADGVCIIAPMNRVDLAAELVDFARTRTNTGRGALS